ncbi:MAG: ATP-binding cassette domain-containing protein [Planctomycetota bacterium]|jgi:ABC-type lipoprotein export system ATPase subunit|nr:MAG: ATP-binding cassette domain-containing protein [Planctomycetota bacterium]
MIISEPEYLLELEGLEQRLFDKASGETFTVRVDQPLRIARRSVVALLGPSGCGKTTLLTVLGLLRSPSHPTQLGRFVMRTPDKNGVWHEHDLRSIWLANRRGQVEKLRREHLGFALQNGELLPALTVRENIATPLKLNGVSNRLCRSRVTDLLQSFGLEDRQTTPSDTTLLKDIKNLKRNLGDQRVNRLSGGEYQRVALARAIAHRPTLLFVDEPTSALNRELAHGALSELRNLQCGSSSHGAAIMITHDEDLAKTFADVIVRMAPRRGESVGEMVEVIKNSPGVEAKVSQDLEVAVVSNQGEIQ